MQRVPDRGTMLFVFLLLQGSIDSYFYTLLHTYIISLWTDGSFEVWFGATPEYSVPT